jgi:PPOX class probable F420-dependent enzyme
MTDLADFRRIASGDSFLCIVATTRADGSVQASLVNAGVMPHPDGRGDVVALVAAGGSAKLAHIRARPRTTVVARTGWEWVAVEGTAELLGPDDPAAGLGADRLRELLRAVFVAAGGSHDDWDEYDRVMAGDRRAVVFVRPERVYSNG